MLTTTDGSGAPIAAPLVPTTGVTMTPTKLLVCEGDCNPGRSRIDEHVEQERDRLFRVQAYGMVVPLDDERTLTALRTLRHTEHRQLSRDWWVCTACSAPRRYGSEL